MTETGRLIAVSNRLPVALEHTGDRWITTRSAGGLATAMDPILQRSGGVWIGWSGTRQEQPAELLRQLREEQNCITVNLPGDIAEKFYEGHSNKSLWPLFHNFVSRLRFDPENWAAYAEANRRFCDAVLNEFRPGDRIWVHDYHLMLLPRMLREKLPDAAIGFFLHIPFPTSDIFSILPRSEEILMGLLGADLICFQTHLHLQHFRRSLRRLASVESTIDGIHFPDRDVRLQALPIGIAPDGFLGQTTSPETQEQLKILHEQYMGRKLILAIDRLDYTKGLPERLRAFGRLLTMSPQLAGKITLLQVAVPSRENVESYQELRSEVHKLVGEINGRFGTPAWVPIVFINRSIARPELVALYQLADVAWVAPLKDGMNLVAKEYVACKPDGDGVLVLSTFAGAAAEMGEALLVNPFDEERTAVAVQRALELPAAERRQRMLALHERVLRNNVFVWGDRFLTALEEAACSRSERPPETVHWAPAEKIVASYGQSTDRLLLLDYDGTLAPFASHPQGARPDQALLELLKQLADDPANYVIVVSGRSAEDLETWLGEVPRLGLAAEHGARYRPPGAKEWELRRVATDWKSNIRSILEHFVERTPGSLVEEKQLALVWHYRTVEPEFGDWLATELVDMLERMLAETELRAYRGNKIVEIKPMWANKGAFVKRMLAERENADFIFCVGDDRTDEDMFVELPSSAWSIHVGAGPTRAGYRAASTEAVRDLLRQFTGAQVPHSGR